MAVPLLSRQLLLLTLGKQQFCLIYVYLMKTVSCDTDECTALCFLNVSVVVAINRVV